MRRRNPGGAWRPPFSRCLFPSLSTASAFTVRLRKKRDRTAEREPPPRKLLHSPFAAGCASVSCDVQTPLHATALSLASCRRETEPADSRESDRRTKNGTHRERNFPERDTHRGTAFFESERRCRFERIRRRGTKAACWASLLLMGLVLRVSFDSPIFPRPSALEASRFVFGAAHRTSRTCHVRPSRCLSRVFFRASPVSSLNPHRLFSSSSSSRPRRLPPLLPQQDSIFSWASPCLSASSLCPACLSPSTKPFSLRRLAFLLVPAFPRTPSPLHTVSTVSSRLFSPACCRASLPASWLPRRTSGLAAAAPAPQASPADFLPEYFHNYPVSDDAETETEFRPGVTAEMEKALLGYEFGVRFSRPSDDRYVPGFTQSRMAAAVRPHKSLAAATVTDALGPRPGPAPRPTGPFDPPEPQGHGDTSETPHTPDPAQQTETQTPLRTSRTDEGPSSSAASLRFYTRFPYDAEAAGAPAGDAREFAAAERRREEEKKKAEREEDKGFQVGLQIKLLREGVLSIMGSGDGHLASKTRGEDAAILLKKKVPVHRLKLFQWDNLEVASAGGHLPTFHLSLVRAVELVRACYLHFGPSKAPRGFAVPPPSRRDPLVEDEATEAAARALLNEEGNADQVLEKFRDRSETRAWPPHLVGLALGEQEDLLRRHKDTLVEDLPAAADELQKVGFSWEPTERAEDEEKEFSIFLEAFAAYLADKRSGPKEISVNPSDEVSLDPLHPSPAVAPPREPPRVSPALPSRLPATHLPPRFFKIPSNASYPEYLWGYPLGAVVAELRRGRKFLALPHAVQMLLAVEFPVHTIDGVEKVLSSPEKTHTNSADTVGEETATESEDRFPPATLEDEGFVEPAPFEELRAQAEAGEDGSGGERAGSEKTGTETEETQDRETRGMGGEREMSGERGDRETRGMGGEREMRGERGERGERGDVEKDAKKAFVEELDIQELRNLLADVVDFEEAAEASVSASSGATRAADPAKPRLAFPVSPYYHLIAPAEFPLPPPARVPAPRRGLRWELQALQDRLINEERERGEQVTFEDREAGGSARTTGGPVPTEEATQTKKRGKGRKAKKTRSRSEKEEKEGIKAVSSEEKKALPFLADRALRYPHTLFSRRRTEGGFHYAFDKWSFDDVVEAMQYFNDMYRGVHREIGGEEQLTFNVLPRGWCIPSRENSTKT
ncbi:hypothetical protein TGARI_202180A [Toxoplasma gondii ARI]|uniref:Uncharacterized protein n=1 Tax=Toxoplasma gondii ARI TaxID=1074872 RepID=A0A139XZ99_TOXGO|nr:hypothetical protein TGARI_202180A [Toxoplasma gondii ARI]